MHARKFTGKRRAIVAILHYPISRRKQGWSSDKFNSSMALWESWTWISIILVLKMEKFDQTFYFVNWRWNVWVIINTALQNFNFKKYTCCCKQYINLNSHLLWSIFTSFIIIIKLKNKDKNIREAWIILKMSMNCLRKRLNFKTSHHFWRSLMFRSPSGRHVGKVLIFSQRSYAVRLRLQYFLSAVVRWKVMARRLPVD